MLFVWQEAIYGKLKVVKESSRGSTKEEGENKPPEPPPIETIPSRRHIDLSPPATPLYSPPWGSPAHVITPLGPNGQMLGNGQMLVNGHTTLERAQSADQRIYEKSSESKKRQRPKTADFRTKDEKTKAAATPPSRYVKAAHKQSGGKHKFFKSRGTKEKDAPPPLGASLSSRGVSSQPSFFHLRYKSLTNLTQQVQLSTVQLSTV